MDIVSIKKFLRPEQPKPQDYIQFLQQLLNAISLQAVQATDVELTPFRKEVSTIAGRLNSASTAEEIGGVVGFVIRAMTGYNRLAARMTHAHLNELQAMLAMMSRTIAFLSDSSKTGIEQLKAVERNLQSASTVGDVRVLRGKLGDCLTLVRTERIRLRDASQAQIVELQAGVERTATHIRNAGDAVPEETVALPPEPCPFTLPDDSPPGFATRDGAERLIAAKISQGKEFVVTVFLIDRFPQVTGRFGAGTGGEVLQRVAHYLRDELEDDSLFQWSGSAFAAIREGGTPLHTIEQQMARIASKRFEKTIENDRQLVLLQVTCSFLVKKVSEGDCLADIAETLDDFVATKSNPPP